jgi:two-component system, LytTR family, response regulator
MKISCLIVEDEPNAMKIMQNYIAQLQSLQLAGCCKDGEEALKFITQQEVDLIFLDINLPDINGLELTSQLGAQNIVITTAYSDYAVQSYLFKAIDYLLKPITFNRFCQAINKAKTVIEHRRGIESTKDAPTDQIFVKDGKKLVNVAFSDILFIESSNEYASIVTVGAKHLVYKRMKDLENSLPQNFIRVHQSFIVNINAISKIEDNQVFVSAKRIPISDKYRSGFKKVVERRLL